MNRSSLLRVFVVVAVLATGVAFALDGRRLDEMLRAIEQSVEDADERSRFSDAVREYISERDAALRTLVIIIESPSEGQLRSDWTGTVSDLGDIPGLYGVSSSLSSNEALRLYDQFMGEEQAWVSALSDIDTAAYRDGMVSLKLGLASKTSELEAQWQETLNADGQIDEKQYRVLADIYGILAELARESDGKRRSVRDSLQIATDLATRVDIIPDAVPGEVASAIRQALGIIAETARQYNAYRSSVESLRPQLRELAGQELGLLLIFGATRESTQEFVEEYGYNSIEALYEQAEDELDLFGNIGTSGQRDDADEFVDLVLSALSEHLTQSESIYREFIAKHELKFVGPVGPDIRHLLTESQLWESEDDKVRGLDIEGFLRAWRDDANSFFSVSLSVDGITDYEREFIQRELESDLRDLRNAIDQAGNAFSTQNLSLIYDRRDIQDGLK